MNVEAEPSRAARRIVEGDRRGKQEEIHAREVAARIKAEKVRKAANRNAWWVEENARHAKARAKEKARLRKIGETGARNNEIK